MKAADPANQIAGVPYTLISYVLAYNPETVKTKPTSWGDLWQPEFRGKLAFLDATVPRGPTSNAPAVELAGMQALLEPLRAEIFDQLTDGFRGP